MLNKRAARRMPKLLLRALLDVRSWHKAAS